MTRASWASRSSDRAFRALRLKAPRIVNRDRDVIAQRLQNSQLLAGKAIHFGMRCGEYSHQALADAQRNRHFRERRRLAADVVLVLAHVGRVAHLTGRGDVADHALAADFQAMSFAVHAASSHSGQHHLAALFVVQVDAGFQAAEGMRHFVDNAVDELVEIENRRDFLRGLLHALQVLDEIGGQSTDGKEFVAGGTGNRSHERPILLAEGGPIEHLLMH